MSSDNGLPEYPVVSTNADLDLHTVSSLRSDLDDALRGSPQGLVLDLSRSGFIDSTGLATIVSAYRRLRSTGGRLALVAPTVAVRRVLSLLDLQSLPDLFICEDLAAAQRALDAGSDA